MQPSEVFNTSFNMVRKRFTKVQRLPSDRIGVGDREGVTWAR